MIVGVVSAMVQRTEGGDGAIMRSYEKGGRERDTQNVDLIYEKACGPFLSSSSSLLLRRGGPGGRSKFAGS